MTVLDSKDPRLMTWGSPLAASVSPREIGVFATGDTLSHFVSYCPIDPPPQKSIPNYEGKGKSSPLTQRVFRKAPGPPPGAFPFSGIAVDGGPKTKPPWDWGG